MSQQKQTRLPKLLRNPITMGEIAVELEEWAETLEKQAAEEGKSARMKPRVLRIKAFALELTTAAEARIGDQLDG